ncbi:MAG TPA: hypothetical protein PK079_18885 [Leptospiraceae bacterium]|nr:hypothetical protein [Leptospiraceae bacterium]HNC01474.1 hypothetical protein [Leptospiraceae bacterium]HNE55246.1 hypothetical protein [Leptospiraceae bacterium]HNF56412.1 hypothetical protein [Leptospiraceae bacterium]HNH01244.1 hypothetical protein [Leptospiraceae bacterium]
MQSFFNGNYRYSIELFHKVLKLYPNDKASSYYIERAETLLANPNMKHENLK